MHRCNKSVTRAYNPYRFRPRARANGSVSGKKGNGKFSGLRLGLEKSKCRPPPPPSPIRIPREHLTAVPPCVLSYPILSYPYTFLRELSFEGHKVQGARYLHSSMYTVVSWLAAREEEKITDDREARETEERERRREEEEGREWERERESDKRRSVTVKQWLPSVPLLPKHLVHVNQ